MTFLEQLKTHIGGLVRLKPDLYLYNTRSHDGIKSRVCLLLDTTVILNPSDGVLFARTIPTSAIMRHASRLAVSEFQVEVEPELAYALLLMDGSLKWVLTSKEDVEFIQ